MTSFFLRPLASMQIYAVSTNINVCLAQRSSNSTSPCSSCPNWVVNKQPRGESSCFSQERCLDHHKLFSRIIHLRACNWNRRRSLHNSCRTHSLAKCNQHPAKGSLLHWLTLANIPIFCLRSICLHCKRVYTLVIFTLTLHLLNDSNPNLCVPDNSTQF